MDTYFVIYYILNTKNNHQIHTLKKQGIHILKHISCFMSRFFENTIKIQRPRVIICDVKCEAKQSEKYMCSSYNAPGHNVYSMW